MEFKCPKCGGCYFGSSTLDGIETVHCHTAGCRWYGERFVGKYFAEDDECCGHGYARTHCPVEACYQPKEDADA